jgi:hypothetical protein
MTTNNKEQRHSVGWETILRGKRVRAEAKEKRLKKEALYRHMVGSVRELRRRMREINY